MSMERNEGCNMARTTLADSIAAYVREHGFTATAVHDSAGDYVMWLLPYNRKRADGTLEDGLETVISRTFAQARRDLGY
jgi:hypothetical protein